MRLFILQTFAVPTHQLFPPLTDAYGACTLVFSELRAECPGVVATAATTANTTAAHNNSNNNDNNTATAAAGQPSYLAPRTAVAMHAKNVSPFIQLSAPWLGAGSGGSGRGSAVDGTTQVGSATVAM
jgi:hypothetical protein